GSRGTLVIPDGCNCLYTGPGLTCADMGSISIRGAHRDASTITLGPSSRLFDIPPGVFADQVEIRGLNVTGGLGVFRSRRTLANSGRDVFLVADCIFSAYSVAAIEVNASDWPWIRIVRNQFWGSAGETGMGVALSGWCDNALLADNAFGGHRVA